MYISASILEILYINHDQFLVCVNQFVLPLYTLSIVRILLIAAILIVRRKLSHYIEAILYLPVSTLNVSGQPRH